jgi:Ca2+-binding RTX toxin-like protein
MTGPDRRRIDRFMRRLTIVQAATAAVLLAVAANAHASGTVSREGSSLVYHGGQDVDNTFVRYANPPHDGATVPSYVFGAFTSHYFLGHTIVTAGPGCSPGPLGYVLCPAAGVDHVELLVNGGDDYLGAGAGSHMPASVAARGGPGNDSALGDEVAPSGPEELFGDAGNDTLTAFSRNVGSTMHGGDGNDRFIWEETDHGVATYADGGAGDDVFDTFNALGPDTIVGGGGADDISVWDRGQGDPDSVSCGAEGVARLRRDSNDHIGSGCRLDAFAKSKHVVKAKVSRWTRGALAGRSTLRLPGMRVPSGGIVSVKLQLYEPSASTKPRVTVRRAGRVHLTFRLSSRFRSAARRAVTFRLTINFRPSTGRERTFTFVNAL